MLMSALKQTLEREKMRMIDSLVQKLPNLGGWPEDADECYWHSGFLVLNFYHDGMYVQSPAIKTEGLIYAGDENGESVSKEEYEAALAARKTEWDGEGLPPVGLVCEGQFPRHPGISFEWQECLVLYVFERECAVQSKGTSTLHYCDDFRPIRSEADKKRDAAIESLMQIVRGPSQASATVNKLYDAISAGKVPGIKLED